MATAIVWTPLIIVGVGIISITFIDLAFWYMDRRDRRGR